MYYEETIIDGVLCCRYSPSGEWKQMDQERLTAYILKLKDEIKELKKS